MRRWKEHSWEPAQKIKTDGYQVDMNIVNSEVQVKVFIAILSICIEGSGYSYLVWLLEATIEWGEPKTTHSEWHGRLLKQ